MNGGSLTIAEFPGSVVEVHCPRCDRRGQYAKVRRVERFGAGIRLPDLLREFAPDCPARNSLNNQSCGAFYPGLRASLVES